MMDIKKRAVRRRGRTYFLSVAAVMTAVTCVIAPLAIPIGPVPISLTNLAIYLSLYLLGWKWGTASCLAYIFIGAAGLPVFSGFAGGLGKLAGPTGGYIVGFLPMALLAGWAIDHTDSRPLQLLGMATGTAICYVLGTAWFCVVGAAEPLSALSLCVFPFLPFDLGKMGLAIAAGPVIRRQLEKAGLGLEGK